MVMFTTSTFDNLLKAVAIRPAGSQYIDYVTRSRMRFYDWLLSLLEKLSSEF